MRKRRQHQVVSEHYRRRLQSAADWAITAAGRAQLSETVTDLNVLRPLRVTVGDVISRARDDFALDVPREDAAEMLRHRLTVRGPAGWSELETDAFDDVEPESDSR